MYKKRPIYRVSLLLLCITMVISENVILQVIHLTPAFLLIPFLLLSFYEFRSIDKRFTKIMYVYFGLIVLSYLIDGLRDVVLLYNLIGTAIIALFLTNRKYLAITSYYVPLYYLFTSFILLVIPFYLGLWEVEEASRRATFLSHNQNVLSWLLNISLLCAILLSDKDSAFPYKKYLKYIFPLYILPILFTVSRTGTMIMVLTFCLYYAKDLLSRIVALVLLSIIAILFISDSDLLNNKVFQQLNDRVNEAREDERIQLWSKGWQAFTEHPVTGIGFSNFNDVQWRYSKKLYTEGFNDDGEYFVNTVSIHNGFIDLGLIGGIFLLITYVIINIYILYWGAYFYFKGENKYQMHSIFIISNILIALSFSYTGQGPTLKYTWFQIGLCIIQIHYIKSQLSSNANQSLPREISSV
jgi:O-antigen ligase